MTILAWQTNNWWNDIGHAAGAFVTSSGFAGLTALGAAYIAWRVAKRTMSANADNIDKQLQADKQKNARAERMQAIIDAIEALNEAKLNVRQRDIVYRESGDAHRSKWRDEAASRHWRLPAAGARLNLHGIDRSGFDTAHKAINAYSHLSYEGADRNKVRAAEKAADQAIRDFTDQITAAYRAVAEQGQ